MTWEDGWPCVGCGVPTTGPQPSPHQRAEPKRLLVPGKVYRLKASQDWGVYLGYEGKLTKSKDEAYVVRSGLKPGGTVSLEAASRPGHFLRHRCGKLELNAAETSQLFQLDASWMALPGLADRGISLRAVNFPDAYVRHRDGQLCSSTFQMDDIFLLDATWIPELV